MSALRQSLERSIALTPSVLEKTLETQREQLATHLEIARKSLDGEDFELAADAFANLSSIARSIHENLEVKNMRLSELNQFTPEARVRSVLEEARKGDVHAIDAIKTAFQALEKTATKKGAVNAR